MINPTAPYAVQGINRAFDDAAKAAQSLVSSFAGETDDEASELDLRTDQTVQSIVDLTKAETAAKASIVAFKVGDEVAGSLLDILA